jgi:hypothetical protein
MTCRARSITSSHYRFLRDEEDRAAARKAGNVPQRRAASCDTSTAPSRRVPSNASQPVSSSAPLRRSFPPAGPAPAVATAHALGCDRAARASEPLSESPSCGAAACASPPNEAAGSLRAGGGGQLAGLRRLGSAPLGPTVGALFGWLGLWSPAGTGNRSC